MKSYNEMFQLRMDLFNKFKELKKKLMNVVL